MKYKQLTATAAACFTALTLSSCIIQQTIGLFIRDTYPGARPPMVIADNNGKPASNNWLSVEEDVLPASGLMEGKVTYAPDGLPYGLSSEFSAIVISPYAPYYNLDCKGKKAGDKVWDPYTRKAFYIPRTFTFN